MAQSWTSIVEPVRLPTIPLQVTPARARTQDYLCYAQQILHSYHIQENHQKNIPAVTHEPERTHWQIMHGHIIEPAEEYKFHPFDGLDDEALQDGSFNGRLKR